MMSAMSNSDRLELLEASGIGLEREMSVSSAERPLLNSGEELTVISTQSSSTTLDVAPSPPKGALSSHSNTATVNTTYGSGEKQKAKRRKANIAMNNLTALSINYKGINIYQAAEQGSLPICVLLWGMASAKRISLIAPDSLGNNPLHFAALADSPEVVTFLLQQTKGEDLRLVESRNALGETPLMKCMSTGVIAIAKVTTFLPPSLARSLSPTVFALDLNRFCSTKAATR